VPATEEGEVLVPEGANVAEEIVAVVVLSPGEAFRGNSRAQQQHMLVVDWFKVCAPVLEHANATPAEPNFAFPTRGLHRTRYGSSPFDVCLGLLIGQKFCTRYDERVRSN
jgi:hypothetical protein